MLVFTCSCLKFGLTTLNIKQILYVELIFFQVHLFFYISKTAIQFSNA